MTIRLGAQVHAVLLLAVIAAGAPGCRHTTESDLTADPQERYVLGEPKDVAIQKFDAPTLKADFYATRHASWKMFLLVNEPQLLRDPRTDQPLVGPDGAQLALPLWQTWYTVDEFRALFGALWARRAETGSPDGPPTEALVNDVIHQHHKRALSDPYWAETSPQGSRLDRFIDALDAPKDARALGGVGHGQTLFSPALVRHALLHFREIANCAANPAPEQPQFGSCLGGPFPANAIAVKANWLKTTDPVPTYDTSPEAITKSLQGTVGEWAANGQVTAPTTTYVAGKFQNLKKQGTYRLVGLSVTSKETPEWLWSTFWWSKDPALDFGADNPLRFPPADSFDLTSQVAQSFPELRNYKMCSVANFALTEPPASAQTTTPETANVLATLLAQGGGSTWCSNPYIEGQTGGANSNCIGCHQHAGPNRGEFEGDVGKAAKRDKFPADFLWSFDSFKESFKDEIVRVMNEGATP